MIEAFKKGMDIPIYVSYYCKERKTYVVDKPVMLSELYAQEKDRFEIAQELCDRCNALGQMDVRCVEKGKTVEEIYVA